MCLAVWTAGKLVGWGSSSALQPTTAASAETAGLASAHTTTEVLAMAVAMAVVMVKAMVMLKLKIAV